MSIHRESRRRRIIALAALVLGLCLLALGTAGCPSKKGNSRKSGPDRALFEGKPPKQGAELQRYWIQGGIWWAPPRLPWTSATTSPTT